MSKLLTSKYLKPRILIDLRHYSKALFSADLMAGLVVGIVALPLAIAFAIAASPGGDAEHTIGPGIGIITAIVAGLIISLFGGKSRADRRTHWSFHRHHLWCSRQVWIVGLVGCHRLGGHPPRPHGAIPPRQCH